jgi:hypothetical protein
VPRRPLPILDAVLGWVAERSARFAPAPPGAAPVLRARAIDAALVITAAAPAVVLVA